MIPTISAAIELLLFWGQLALQRVSCDGERSGRRGRRHHVESKWPAGACQAQSRDLRALLCIRLAGTMRAKRGQSKTRRALRWAWRAALSCLLSAKQPPLQQLDEWLREAAEDREGTASKPDGQDQQAKATAEFIDLCSFAASQALRLRSRDGAKREDLCAWLGTLPSASCPQRGRDKNK